MLKTPKPELFTGFPPGTWVAIDDDQEKVVATGASVAEVLQKAHADGHQNPLVLCVLPDNLSLIL
jgi:hypothetical protein